MTIAEIISPEEKQYLLELRANCRFFGKAEIRFLTSTLGNHRVRYCCHGHHDAQFLPLDEFLGQARFSPILVRTRRGMNAIL